MIREAKILVDAVKKLQELLPLINRLDEKQAEISCEEVVDIAFACREVEDTFDTFMKSVRALSRKAQHNACLQMEEMGLDKVQTECCTASPNPKIWYAIPHKREGKEYLFDGIMEAIGVPKEVAENELVRFHAPAFMDYCTKLVGEGRKPPLGITEEKFTGTELNLRITKRRRKDEDSAEV